MLNADCVITGGTSSSWQRAQVRPSVFSALDYDRLLRAKEADTLLFVAHREEILQQSLHTFRTCSERRFVRRATGWGG